MLFPTLHRPLLCADPSSPWLSLPPILSYPEYVFRASTAFAPLGSPLVQAMAHRIADSVQAVQPTIVHQRSGRAPPAYQEMTLQELANAIKPDGPYPGDKIIYFTLNQPVKVVSMPMGANTNHKLTYEACDHTSSDGRECPYGVKHSNGQATCRSPEQHNVQRTRTRYSVDVVVSEVHNPTTQITFSFGHDVVENVILKKPPQQVYLPFIVFSHTPSHHPSPHFQQHSHPRFSSLLPLPSLSSDQWMSRGTNHATQTMARALFGPQFIGKGRIAKAKANGFRNINITELQIINPN